MKKNSENKDTQNESLVYFENRINEYLEQYEIENGIKIIDIKRNVFNHILMDIYRYVFKPYCIGIPERRKNTVIPYCNSSLLSGLCDYYIYICYKYNKSITIQGYTYMMGLNNTVLDKWSKGINRKNIYIDINNNNREVQYTDISKYKSIYSDCNIVEMPNDLLSSIHKKLTIASENNLAEMAIDGSVMALAMGKIKHGWEEGKKAQVQAKLLETYTSPQELLKNYSENDSLTTGTD